MLNFSIIGCGAIAARHARHAASTGRLMALCDIVPRKAATLANEYEARAYHRIEDLLEQENEVDVVAICTPNGLHAEQSILALQKGFHVICEKPMALTSEDARRMLDAAEKAGRHLFVVKQNRFNPPVVAVKKWLDEGRLGRIYSVQVNCSWNRTPAYYQDSWHGTQDMDGGILFTQFSHFIDILYWMVGDVAEVKAFTRNYAHQGTIVIEDTGVACLRFVSGAIGTLHFTINSYRKNMEGSVTLVAEKGTVKIGGQYLNELEYQELQEGIIPVPVTRAGANDYGFYQGSMSNHDRIYAHVAAVIEGKGKNDFSGYEGLKTVETIEKIYRSTR
jgi:predicted dehydrogenase